MRIQFFSVKYNVTNWLTNQPCNSTEHSPPEEYMFSASRSGVPWRGGGANPPPPEIPETLQNRAKLNPTVKTV